MIQKVPEISNYLKNPYKEKIQINKRKDKKKLISDKIEISKEAMELFKKNT